MSDLYELDHPAKPRMPRAERKAIIKSAQQSRGEDLERKIGEDRAACARGTIVLPWWLAAIKRRNQNSIRSLGKMPKVLAAYLAEVGILEAGTEQTLVHFSAEGQIILVIRVQPQELGKTLWPAA